MFELASEPAQEDPALLVHCFCFLFNPNKFYGTDTEIAELRVAGAEANYLEQNRLKTEVSVLSRIRLTGIFCKSQPFKRRKYAASQMKQLQKYVEN